MGNQSGKESNENESPNTARSPQRNRNIRNVKNQRHIKTIKENVKQESKLQEKDSKKEMMVRKKVIKDYSSDLRTEKKLYVPVTKNSNKKSPERNIETTAKLRKSGNIRKNQNEEAFKEPTTKKQYEENMKTFNVTRKRQSCNKLGKRNASKVPTQHEASLISDIFNTVAELESTFLDEKKYERRLRSAYSKQIESMQQLKLSLHIEKERNKRLMELMNRYDNAETCTFKENNNDAFKSLSLVTKERTKLKEIENINETERSKWTYQHSYSNAADTPISPMLMKQRYDELSKSYALCQTELKQKDKLLTLAHCKQEALQAKCDRLTEQIFSSQRKIESLRRKHVNLHKKDEQKELNDYFDSDENQDNAVATLLESPFKSKMSSVTKAESFKKVSKECLLDGLEKYNIVPEVGRLLPKAKAE